MLLFQRPDDSSFASPDPDYRHIRALVFQVTLDLLYSNIDLLLRTRAFIPSSLDKTVHCLAGKQYKTCLRALIQLWRTQGVPVLLLKISLACLFGVVDQIIGEPVICACQPELSLSLSLSLSLRPHIVSLIR